jgi:AAA15 family ATPase/GTPase
MMLKKLELTGFKSFAKHSTLFFDTPITAIVGPNGSGKSNTVEALRFVLGEQSQKSLRSKSGADLVFKGSPWLFSSSYERWKTPETLADRLRIMVEHTKLYQELLPHKSFAIMKKHYKAYVSGFDGASELRAQLMAANSADEIASIVEKYIVTLTN